MVNPMNALMSLQTEIFNGIPLRSCAAHPSLKMFYDQPNGRPRFTFAKVESQLIKAFAVVAITETIQSLPCVNLGYAVPPEYRQQGLGTEIVKLSINELKAEFKRNGVNEFYVEAVVGVQNIASQRLAAKLLSANFEKIKDDVSGEDAYYYCLKVQ
ncbi:GNAT family N-acetyltransferase [Agarivorans gilvus]|nr:GNAT family N-acetyltransferase [Agarivorans gilvus]